MNKPPGPEQACADRHDGHSGDVHRRGDPDSGSYECRPNKSKEGVEAQACLVHSDETITSGLTGHSQDEPGTTVCLRLRWWEASLRSFPS
jgi:hypothetical protein